MWYPLYNIGYIQTVRIPTRKSRVRTHCCRGQSYASFWPIKDSQWICTNDSHNTPWLFHMRRPAQTFYHGKWKNILVRKLFWLYLKIFKAYGWYKGRRRAGRSFGINFFAETSQSSISSKKDRSIRWRKIRLSFILILNLEMDHFANVSFLRFLNVQLIWWNSKSVHTNSKRNLQHNHAHAIWKIAMQTF